MDAAWEAGSRPSTRPTRTAAGAARPGSATGCGERRRRDEIVLSTKTFNPMDEGDDHGLAPARVKRQLEIEPGPSASSASDCISRTRDPDVPIAETAGAFDELVAEGKVGAFGAEQRRRRDASRGARRRQLRLGADSYSLLDRERSARCCRCAPSTVSASRRSARSPEAGSPASTDAGGRPGRLADDDRPEPYPHLRDDALRRLDGLAAAAAERGVRPRRCLAWLLADPRVTASSSGHAGPTTSGPRSRRSPIRLARNSVTRSPMSFGSSPSHNGHTTREPEVEEMLNAYAAAVRTKDVDAFVGLYADDVRNFDLWAEWSYDGKEALRGMVAEWFGSTPRRRGRGREVRRRPHPGRGRRGCGSARSPPLRPEFSRMAPSCVR